MRYSIGVDLGGSNIRIAIVDENGNIHKVIKEPTIKNGGLPAIVDQIVNLYNKIDSKAYNIIGLGIGTPGPVNSEGQVHFISNLNITEPFSFKELLKDKINLPIYTGNDANVAALAEATVGNGKGYDVVQYITLSTGIGGGLIINKKIITGKYGFAQEVGNMIVKLHGRQPSILKPHGCIEGEASGTELTKKGIEAGLDVKNAGDIFLLASQNNQKAIEIKNDFIECTAAFISNIVAYIEPDIFILGGGVMKSSEYFFDELIEKVKEYVLDGIKEHVLIVPAKYDQDCGIIGAAMQCF